MATTNGTKRPVTRALDIVKAARFKVVAGEAHYELAPAERDELYSILHDENAASGTTDERTAKRAARTRRHHAKTATTKAKPARARK